MMFSHKNHTNRIKMEYKQLQTAECGEAQFSSDRETDSLKDDVKARKRGLLRLLISFGILLPFSVSLCYLVPYARMLSSRTYQIAPTLIVNDLLMPLFWLLLGWTLMQALNVVGLVDKKQTRLKPVIQIACVVLLLLYIAALLPFSVESIKCMILSLKSIHSSGEFSYTYGIPMFFQDIAYYIMIFNYKSGVFSALGVIIWVCGPEKQINRRNIKERPGIASE